MATPKRQTGSVGSGRFRSLIFSNWREVLHASSLSKSARGGYALAIGGYLDYCRRNGLRVTAESARGYMGEVERRQLARHPQLWKEALNWFFRKGRESSGADLRGLPSSGQADTLHWVGAASDRATAPESLLLADRADLPGLGLAAQ